MHIRDEDWIAPPTLVTSNHDEDKLMATISMQQVYQEHHLPRGGRMHFFGNWFAFYLFMEEGHVEGEEVGPAVGVVGYVVP